MQPVRDLTDVSFRFLLSQDRVERTVLEVTTEKAFLLNKPDGSLEVCCLGRPEPELLFQNFSVPDLRVGENIKWMISCPQDGLALQRPPFEFIKGRNEHGCSLSVRFCNSNPLRFDGLLNKNFFNKEARGTLLTAEELAQIDCCCAYDTAGRLHLLVLRPNNQGQFVLTAYSARP